MSSNDEDDIDVNSSPIAADDNDFAVSRAPTRKCKLAESAARQASRLLMESNPNAYFYRHVAPGQVKRTGPWDADEQKLFLRVTKIRPPSSGKWGLFARHVPNRVGCQCRNFCRRLLAGGLDAPTSDDGGGPAGDHGNDEQGEGTRDAPGEEPPPVAEAERAEREPPADATGALAARAKRSPQFVKFPRPLRK
jgi:hypothetical protein